MPHGWPGQGNPKAVALRGRAPTLPPGTSQHRLSYLRMDPNLTAIERAFQAAKSGEAESMDDILRLLKKEGYQVQYVDGLSVRRQLRGLMKGAKSLRGRPGPLEA